mgnify:CR=1 FL=1
MRALGVRFLDAQGHELEGKGEDLTKVADIDVGGLHPAVSQARFTVMCDVTNPLTGPDGATFTFWQAERRHARNPGYPGRRHDPVCCFD